MPKTRTSTLNLRIHPALKDAVREAAAREHRSVANMVEVLIRRHCDQSGITVYEKPVKGKVKTWVSLDAAARWVRGLGVGAAQVQLTHWQPGQRELL
jgi:hypothetical protein